MIWQNGTVYLVGAGPGDPELLTIKGLRILQSAQVVVHDRLVDDRILQLCSIETELIDVGKTPRNHQVTQQQINHILVDRALRGLTVVRLKGGDPFVFGRGWEELQACRDAGLDCQVIPGVSSCLAGPASVGIPVTHRGIARSFAVVTAQTDPHFPQAELDFQALASIDTVVFMMGHANLPYLTDSLIAAGRDPQTPVACIQNATTERQRALTGVLGNIASRVKHFRLANPLVTIVGNVAALSNDTSSATLLKDQTLHEIEFLGTVGGENWM